MAKLSNTSKGDLIFPGEVIIPAQTSNVEVDDEIIDTWGGKKNKVIQGWIDDGKLVIGDYEPLEEDAETEESDGYDKMTKQQLMDEADAKDLDFDEKKVTKADLIALLRGPAE